MTGAEQVSVVLRGYVGKGTGEMDSVVGVAILNSTVAVPVIPPAIVRVVPDNATGAQCVHITTLLGSAPVIVQLVPVDMVVMPSSLLILPVTGL